MLGGAMRNSAEPDGVLSVVPSSILPSLRHGERSLGRTEPGMSLYSGTIFGF